MKKRLRLVLGILIGMPLMAQASVLPVTYNVLCSTFAATIVQGVIVQPLPQQIPIVAQDISSVLGEPRPSNSAEGLRFHQGTDIADCKGNYTVGAIEAGTAEQPPLSVCATGSDCVRIDDGNGHAFDYIHVALLISLPSHVVAGQTIGTIDASDHLHLNDVDVTGGFDDNAQRPSALQFLDSGVPQFVPATGGQFSFPALVPIQQPPAGVSEDGLNLEPTPFPSDPQGGYVVNGVVDFLATFNDPNPNLPSSCPMSRRGIYSMTLKIFQPNDPNNLVYNGYFGANNIQFDSVLDGNAISQSRTIYLQQNSCSNTYFATNRKVNFTPGINAADGNDFDSRTVIPGNYEACVYAGGLTGLPAGMENVNGTCIAITISSGPSTISLTQNGAPGTVLSTSPAGAEWFGEAAGAGIPPQPDLDFGLADAAGLSGLDIFNAFGNLVYANSSLGGSTSLSLAVTATSSGARFPDGREYASVLSDVLGNASTGYFNFDATPPQVQIADINLGPGGDIPVPNPIPGGCFVYPPGGGAGAINGSYSQIPVTISGQAVDPAPYGAAGASGIAAVFLSQTVSNFNLIEKYTPSFPGCVPSIYDPCLAIPSPYQGPLSPSFSLGPAQAPVNNSFGFDQSVLAFDSAGNASGAGVGLYLFPSRNSAGQNETLYYLTVCGGQTFPAVSGQPLVAALNDAAFDVSISSVIQSGVLTLYISPAPLALAFPVAGNQIFHAQTTASFGGPVNVTISYQGMNLNTGPRRALSV